VEEIPSRTVHNDSMNEKPPAIPIEEKIRIHSAVILKELNLTLPELNEIQQRGFLNRISLDGLHTLEAEGTPVARGRIIRRRGKYFFKITETGEES